MITHIIGKLGSGKTLYAVSKIILTLLLTDKHVYTNVRLRDYWDYRMSTTLSNKFRHVIRFLLSPFADKHIYRAWLAKSYAQRYHYYSDLNELVAACLELTTNKEHTRLFVWDEIHLELNAREWKSTSMNIIKFFSMSRKLGFDIIMITQLKTALDRQVRDLAEEVYELKNLANYRPLGYRIFPHVGMLSKRYADASAGEGASRKGMFMGFEIIRYNSAYINFYDTLQLLTRHKVEPPKTWSTNYADTVICGNCQFLQFYRDNWGFVKDFKPDNITLRDRPPLRDWTHNFIRSRKEDYFKIVEKMGSENKLPAEQIINENRN